MDEEERRGPAWTCVCLCGGFGKAKREAGGERGVRGWYVVFEAEERERQGVSKGLVGGVGGEWSRARAIALGLSWWWLSPAADTSASRNSQFVHRERRLGCCREVHGVGVLCVDVCITSSKGEDKARGLRKAKRPAMAAQVSTHRQTRPPRHARTQPTTQNPPTHRQPQTRTNGPARHVPRAQRGRHHASHRALARGPAGHCGQCRLVLVRGGGPPLGDRPPLHPHQLWLPPNRLRARPPLQRH